MSYHCAAQHDPIGHNVLRVFVTVSHNDDGEGDHDNDYEDYNIPNAIKLDEHLQHLALTINKQHQLSH